MIDSKENYVDIHVFSNRSNVLDLGTLQKQEHIINYAFNATTILNLNGLRNFENVDISN